MKRTIFLAALAATSLASVRAATITIMPAATMADAIAARNAWLTASFGAGTAPLALESFESFNYGPFTTLATGAGVFSIPAGALVSDGYGTHNNDFTILNSSDTPFSGRYNTTPGGNNWLDSNDLTMLQLATSLNTLYFFITDINDIDGTLRIQTADGTSSANFSPSAPDGNLYFVAITSPGPIGSIQWLNNTQHDGFGLDDIGTAAFQPALVPAPEPVNWLAAATGLLILAAALRRRDRKRTSPAKAPTASREQA